MGRQPCCDKVGLKRGPWTADEDRKLINFILNHGIHCWRLVPKLAGLLRCGKSCRLRWTNYLRPDLKRVALSEEEENQIIQLHSRLGNKWSKIASHFPGRTDNEIKNHWNTRIKKRLKLLDQASAQKPVEQHERCESEGSQSSDCNHDLAKEEQEEGKKGRTTAEIIDVCEDFQRKEMEQEGPEFHNNGMDGSKVEEGMQLPQENMASINGCNGNSLFPTNHEAFNMTSLVGEDLYNLDGFWDSDTIEPIPSWEGFYHLEDFFSFEDNYP